MSSYVHLKREGVEGYVNDFNSMVKKIVVGITGDCAVEILPEVPVVFEGLDKVGSELNGGLRSWIEWIAEKSGRKEISELAKMGGREKEELSGGTGIWKSTFMVMHGKQVGLGVVKRSGNMLTLLRGERVEWSPRSALPAREIRRMMSSRDGEQSESNSGVEKEEEKKRESQWRENLHSQKRWGLSAKRRKRQGTFWRTIAST